MTQVSQSTDEGEQKNMRFRILGSGGIWGRVLQLTVTWHLESRRNGLITGMTRLSACLSHSGKPDFQRTSPWFSLVAIQPDRYGFIFCAYLRPNTSQCFNTLFTRATQARNPRPRHEPEKLIAGAIRECTEQKLGAIPSFYFVDFPLTNIRLPAQSALHRPRVPQTARLGWAEEEAPAKEPPAI